MDNYGAVLQAYALLETIGILGGQGEIINFIPKLIRQPYDIFFNIKDSLTESGLIRTARRLGSHLYHYAKIKKRIRNFANFRNKYFQISNTLYKNSSDLIKNRPFYDFYITGSDQVWNPHFFFNVGDCYFLDFSVEHSVRISYAASIGEDVVDKTFYDCFKRNLNTFNYISVRESSAKTFLSKFIKKDIHITIDPTLLLNREDWLEIADFDYKVVNYILVYDLVYDSVIVSVANHIAKALGCKIVSFTNKRKNYHNWARSFNTCGPTEFLGLINNAQFIVTSSFHGTAFAILFHKPFYTIPHPTRGSRMINLLTELDLLDRLIQSEDVKIDVHKSIDYDKVNLKLTKLRIHSLKFLKKALDEQDVIIK